MTYAMGPCAAWIDGTDVDCDSVADPAILQMAADAAVDALFHLSGMQFTGSCARTVRPGYRKCDCGVYSCRSLTWVPEWAYTEGQWWHDPYICCDTSRARLGFYPITSITSVEIGGVALAPADYAVDEYTELVRVDGTSWPLDDTWEVEFVAGIDPPAMAILAAQKLACEIAKLIAGADGCALPQRVTSVTRQGISMALDPIDYLREGKTGIYIVDLFLMTHNPDGLHSSPSVVIPNQPRQITRTT